MSGPIVRSGPSPEFSRNWENVFGKKSGGSAAPAGKKSAKKTAVKSAKTAAGKKSKKSGK